MVESKPSIKKLRWIMEQLRDPQTGCPWDIKQDFQSIVPPLALYLCSHDKTLQKQFIEQTHAGGMCINDATLQVAQDDMPFGGIGASGMGHYHGHEGFLTLSKAKSVLEKGKFSSSSMAFPPYGKIVHRLIYKFFMR